MPAEAKRRSLLELAAEGMVPVLGGCAGYLAGGAQGGMIGVAAAKAAEKAVNIFGGKIVQNWVGYFRNKPPAEQVTAIAALADLSPSGRSK